MGFFDFLDKKTGTEVNKSTNDDNWMEVLWDWANKNNISEFEVVDYPKYNMKEEQGLPRDKQQLLSFRKLILNSGSFSFIPKEIGMLTNLQEIGIYTASLEELPKEIGNLTNLTYLSLPNNKLEILPDEIGNLKNLKKLNLSGNKIKNIPNSLGNLTNLTDLNLGDTGSNGNYFKNLPLNIINLKNLTRIMLWSEFPLSLTSEQKIWLSELKSRNCTIGGSGEVMDCIF